MENNTIFTSLKKESSVEFVINSFKELILLKKLIPGDSVPSETVLAESLNVSRGTIREAMKILSAFGIIEIKRGDGTYISKSIGNTLFDPFLFSLMMSDTDTKQLVELRESMENQIIILLIKNAEESDLNKIRAAYQMMENHIMSGDTDKQQNLIQYDIDFHQSLGNATKNVLLEKIYNFVMELFIPHIKNTYKNKDNGQKALQLHKEILDAILERNVDRALKATHKSIDEWKPNI